MSPIIYWAKIIQYNPHSISTKPFLSPLIFYWAEIWIKEDSEIRILYKKSEEWLLIPHSGEESVVISYGILFAKVQKNPLLNQ